MPVAELQVAIIVAALIAGALRGLLGYFLAAPDEEPFMPRKAAKTVLRYAIFNLAAVNAVAAGGVHWTVAGVFVFAFMQLAMELGFDLQKYMKA